MKNNLVDLNNYLFESIERLMDDSLNDEQMEREIARAEAVTDIAETIIKNGELALRSMKFSYDSGIGAAGKGEAELPPMLKAGV